MTSGLFVLEGSGIYNLQVQKPLFGFKKLFLYVFLFLLMLTSIACPKQSQLKGIDRPIVSIRGVDLPVELAITPEQRVQGLSGRSSLPANTGMLFIFEEPTIPAFWMKDMSFPLDFIWIKDKRVVALDENVPAPRSDQNSPPVYTSPQIIDSVLEVNAGFVAQQGVRVGDLVEFKFIPR
jgi:uncharacterized membrane protein (UPF0127 family)